ncbi:MAG: glutamate 5-kinase [Bacilli bacterium]|jgi:glutamate 5-kinase|nr:glutamate 5-kinase [Bacilli bacterium]
MNKHLNNIKRIVVKVGTSTIIDPQGFINKEKIFSLIKDIVELRRSGYEVILVSSGAVGCGNVELNIKKNTSLSQKQASAAVGQITLLNYYYDYFKIFNTNIGQLLLTRYDIENRKNNLNATNTINELLKQNIVPIINENDSTVIDEIKVGDNDNLGALISILAQADLYIILSDIDGIYTDNPKTNKDAQFLDIIEKVDDKIISYASGKGSEFATGGMATKLEAAIKVNAAGIKMIITDGSVDGVLGKVMNHNIKYSLFLESDKKLVAKKKFLLTTSKMNGSIIIDEGACQALIKDNASLLPVGVKEVIGTFDIGDAIEIKDLNNKVIALGIVNYSNDDINEIKGLHTNEFKRKLSNKYLYDTIVHKDNLVIK